MEKMFSLWDSGEQKAIQVNTLLGIRRTWEPGQIFFWSWSTGRSPKPAERLCQEASLSGMPQRYPARPGRGYSERQG